MAVLKDRWNGYKGTTWRVVVTYKDWKGNNKRHDKCGFTTKKEALEHEREFVFMKSKDNNMLLDTFLDIYLEDMKPTLRYSSFKNKSYLIEKHIRPHLGKIRLSDIDQLTILKWRNEMLSVRGENGQAYSATYLRTIENQLSAALNHAVKYYGLSSNPCLVDKKMGKSKADEMSIWTEEEFNKFVDTLIDKPQSFTAFMTLFWTGIRIGELLALTPADIDFEAQTISISKSYQRIDKTDFITDPKTPKGKRIISIPDFLCKYLMAYKESLLGIKDTERLFPLTKSFLEHEIVRGAKFADVKRIRIHDLRHSHASLLISMGFSIKEIQDRLGHEKAETTLNTYAHLYSNSQSDLAVKLNSRYKERR